MVSLILRPSILHLTGCFTASIVVQKSEVEGEEFETGVWDEENSIVMHHMPFEKIVDRFVEIIKKPPINTETDIGVFVKDREGKGWLIGKKLKRQEMIRFLDTPEALFRPIAEEIKARGLW